MFARAPGPRERYTRRSHARLVRTRTLPGVLVTSVPYQLQFQDRRWDVTTDLSPADARRNPAAARDAGGS